MNKITLSFFASLVALSASAMPVVSSTSFAQNEQSVAQSASETITLPYFNNFDAVTNGSSASSGSSMPEIKNIESIGAFTSATKVYAAGGKVKLSSGSSAGKLYTAVINAEGTSTIKVKFKAIAWVQTSSFKTSAVNVTYGGKTVKVMIDHKPELKSWPVVEGDLVEYEVIFEVPATPSAVSFVAEKDTDFRFFLDDITIEAGETTALDQVAQNASVYAAAGQLFVEAKAGETISVYSTTGVMLAQATATAEKMVFNQLPAGNMVIVTVGAASYKVML